MSGRVVEDQVAPACDKTGIDLKVYLKKFPDICMQKFGRTYDFGSLEDYFVAVREGKRALAARDITHIFYSSNTPFGRYWPQPNKKDLEKVLSGNRILLNTESGNRADLVRALLRVFHNLGVASIVLRFVHPAQFAVFSTPVLHMIQVNRPETVGLYLAYCDELAVWAKRFGISTVAQTELAVWTLAEIIRNAETDKEASLAAARFDGDLWLQRRRAAQVVGPFLRHYGRLQLARILLDEDHRLAGKIAADEYERLLGLASKAVYGRPLQRKKGSAEQLMDELERRGLISLPEKTELRRIWETRNDAVHPGGWRPTCEAVEVMIDRIEEICLRWDRQMETRP